MKPTKKQIIEAIKEANEWLIAQEGISIIDPLEADGATDPKAQESKNILENVLK